MRPLLTDWINGYSERSILAKSWSIVTAFHLVIIVRYGGMDSHSGFLIPLTNHGVADPQLGSVRVNVCLQRCHNCGNSINVANCCYQILPNLPQMKCPFVDSSLHDLLKNNTHLLRSSSSNHSLHKPPLEDNTRCRPPLKQKPVFPNCGDVNRIRHLGRNVKCHPVIPPASSRS